MNIRKELIKAGFEASIRLQKMKGTDDVEVTVYSDSGYELLIGMTEQDAG